MPSVSYSQGRVILCTIILLLALFGVQGCGSSFDSAVRGIVTLDGKPLTDGTVQFHPVGDGPSSYGSIFDGGVYQMGTGSESGLVPGKYKVTVMATEAPPANLPLGQTPPVGKRLTPEKYGTVDATPFEFDVKDGDNTIDLALTTK